MRKGPPEPAAERIPNLAPMVDIIMVILVFFMLGTSLNLISEGGLQTALDPSSGPGAGAAVEIIPLVKIALQDADEGQSCNVYVLGDRIDGGLAGLRGYMQRRRDAGADPASPIVIGAESRVRWKFVIGAMDAVVAAGFRNVQFAVGLDRVR